MDEFERKWRAFNLKMVQSAEMFLHTIDEILFANIDVTSSVLAFLLINLARNVAAQTDLRAEILEHTADSEAYIQKTDTLLEYTCMESIRLCPAAWFSLPEHATSDMTVGGYLVPAGTPCIMDWWRLNTQSPVWNTETVSGTTFWPRRFESVTPQEYRWSFLRFGLGSRKCIGKNFSAVIMKTFLVAVLKEWKLQTVGLTREEELDMVETRKDRFTVTPDQRVAFARV
ncbi:cytochrome P450 CYP5293A1 [Neofusicoccum parvum]|nr:cytochrome P450 CYP5293A1 [Neofusicoccum parvum]